MASFFPRFLKFQKTAVSLPAAAAASYPGGFGPPPPHWWYPGAPPPSPSSQPPRFLRFSPNRLRRDSPSSGDQFRRLRYGFCPIFHALADGWGGDDHAEFGAPDSADICCHCSSICCHCTSTDGPLGSCTYGVPGACLISVISGAAC
ncbi:hypothetical protein L3X38_012474 [Prunus dulcis]|uniref:Uncharacterized protein n=1 Tax=Prunus dulcis TaxID=3755 RepID=A0AAD4WM56_PRUDU|nr:hypothetical protein L3X38_012474 [Prunus dulcis]